MKEWLRSEPESLSFNEVWDDLSVSLARRRSFKTLKTKTPFEAWLDDDAKRIVISTKSKNYFCQFDTLLDFWHQLSRYGFSVYLNQDIPTLQANVFSR